MIASARLCGLSLDRAELYGKPHAGARYTGSTARRYERTSDRCCVCGRMATSCHHVAHLGWGDHFVLRTPRGTWSLRSPLFALCGDGTTGCHDGFHGGARLRARWEWDSEAYRDAWWDGRLLERFGPHNPALYCYGRWVIEDVVAGEATEIREA